MSAARKIAQFPSQKVKGECELVGNEYPLIPPGEYEAVFSYFETNPRFSRKTQDPEIHAGGKVYLWFDVDPYGNGGLPPGENRLLFLPYNAKAIKKPFGRNGNLQMGKRSKCFKDYQRLIGKAGSTLSPSAYAGKLWKVRVKTVERNEKQKKHKPEDRYSEIVEIIGPA